MIEERREAIRQGLVNNRLSGYVPSDFGRAVFEIWIAGGYSADEAVTSIKAHYRAEAVGELGDGAARSNSRGITDSAMQRSFEADVTTIRMAELYLGGS